MCSNNEGGLTKFEPKPDLALFRKCLKCDKNSVVVTRINDAMCKECFVEYFTHKFRATIGKSKLFDKDEVVMFPYSSSDSSVAMLHLLFKGVGEEAKKKFTFKTICVYIEDNYVFESNSSTHERITFMENVKKSVEYSGFKFYYSLIENCLEPSKNIVSDEIAKLNLNNENKEKFLNLINSCKNQTSKEELLKRLKTQLINRIAIELKIKKIIFPVSCTNLTIDMLTNVALGKGAHLSIETSLEEKLSNGLVYVRPLRELTSKEIAFYNRYNNIDSNIMAKSSSLKNLPNSTIYRLTEKFINSLQNEYPTTVPTIFRTSDKLTPTDELCPEDSCMLCELPVDTIKKISANSSAINDLEYSLSISRLDNTAIEKLFVLKSVCYSCSVVLKDVGGHGNLPQTIKDKIKSRDNLKDKIKEFLIED
ncbi:unnamed protein product [Brachionus calyciflorus]|uniref:Cytoplasmic tRNA 2-thiolation protein 2 n=1 Tax=Brachionus calyciflorus TaxID=104777 RepID=A0A814C474_9BILA|nr:unnamed protein product [Brachionus calyciflorus]